MGNEEAIEILYRELGTETENRLFPEVIEARDMAIKALQEQKVGKWIEKDGWDGDVYYDCSVCGESWTTIEGTPWDNDMNYCPHCGAKMEGAEE